MAKGAKAAARFASVYQQLDSTPIGECLSCGSTSRVVNRVCEPCRQDVPPYFYRPWHERAACRVQDSAPWHTETYSINRKHPLASYSVRVAKAGCAVCPVRRQCLMAGLVTHEGIWGGTLPEERLGATSKEVSTLLEAMTQQAIDNGLRGAA